MRNIGILLMRHSSRPVYRRAYRLTKLFKSVENEKMESQPGQSIVHARTELRGKHMSKPSQKSSKTEPRSIDFNEISAAEANDVMRRDSQEPCDREFLSYDQLFNRFIGLGANGNFEQRDREFMGRKAAASLFGKSPNGLDHMIEDGRVAHIRMGGTLLIHIPTSRALLRQGKRWEHGPSSPKRPKPPGQPR
jgi:hypothetical protein